MRTVDAISFNGLRALVRVDFNVPLDKKTFQVTDDTRIRAAIPTLHKILKDGGSLVLMSHLGRPLKKRREDGSVDVERHTLHHVLPALEKALGQSVTFVSDCVSEEAFALTHQLKPGEVVLLENLRFYPGEEKGDEAFARQLARHGDVFVNDAFGTAHRAHASTTVVAHAFSTDKKVFGYLMSAEVTNATRVLHEAEKPFVAILGGAKVSDKLLLIENLLDLADVILIGGGMAYTFFQAMGGKTGNSLCEQDRINLALELMEKARQKGVQLLLPEDSVVADAFSAEAQVKICPSNDIADGWMALDIGPQAMNAYRSHILQAKTILWNGPMGVFEMIPFQQGTKAVAEAVAEATSSGAFSLVGGGDSVAAVHQFKLADQVSYVSTGGGAMLEFFEGKILPGIQALSDQ